MVMLTQNLHGLAACVYLEMHITRHAVYPPQPELKDCNNKHEKDQIT